MKIDQAKKQMPVMRTIWDEFKLTTPFKGLKIGACMHMTKETAVLLLAIKDGGAEVLACASNPMSTQNDVVDELLDKGVAVFYAKKGMTDEEYKQGLWAVASRRPDYILDDGADLTRLMHEIGEPYPKGGLEETTTGVTRIKIMDLKYPIIAVNDAQTKHFFDNVYGTGQSTIDGIIRETKTLLSGKTFVVAGYGYCGKGLATRARGMGANVIVTEIDPIKALQAYMDGFRVMTMEDASDQGDIFVTVTGSKNVITNEHMKWMKPDVILANSGHFDVEIDVEEAKRLNLNILANGRLVNLACADGHPAEVMDMSFANQALGLLHLVKMGFEMRNRVYNIPEEIDNKVAELKLKALGITIDIETDEQKEYKKS